MDQNNSTYHYLLGEAHTELDEFEDAEDAYTKAITLKASEAT